MISGNSLLDISTAQASVAATSSPTYGQAAQVALNGTTAYVLDAAARSLQVVNLDPLGTGLTVSVPPGSDQLVTKDNLVFVNSDSSAQAVIVNTNGQVTPVTKYIPGPSSQEPSSFSGATTPCLRPPRARRPTGSQPGTGPIATPSPRPPPRLRARRPAADLSSRLRLRPPCRLGARCSQCHHRGVPERGDRRELGTAGVDGLESVTKYNVTVTSQTSATDVHPASVNAPTTSASVSGGLKGDTTYCAVVQAFNAAGGGPLSLNNGAANTCARTSNDTPGPVGGVTAAGGYRSATINWSAVTALGPFNTPITGYAVTLTSGATTKASTVAGSATSTTVGGLVDNTAYTVSVQAETRRGTRGRRARPRWTPTRTRPASRSPSDPPTSVSSPRRGAP